MVSTKNVFGGLAFVASLLAPAAAAKCSVKAERTISSVGGGVSQSISIKDGSGNEIGSADNFSCFKNPAVNMVDGKGLDYPVAVKLHCSNNIDECKIDYGPQHDIEGEISSSGDIGGQHSTCNAEFDC